MDISRKQIAIIATAHHSFAGGGKNKTRVLHELSKRGYDVQYIGLKKPHLFEYTKTKVKLNICNPPVAHAFEDNNIFLEASLTEKITQVAIEKLKEGKQIILWGSNLFPFVNAVFLAKYNISVFYNKNIPLISSPVGSDIWQIGPYHPHNVKRMLFSSLIDCRIAYTEKFANEIYQLYGNGGIFRIIPPVLDTDTFFPISIESKSKLRQESGFPTDSLLVVHHSNMRPIKNPLEAIKIVHNASKCLNKDIVLLMIGPIPNYRNPFYKNWEHKIINKTLNVFKDKRLTLIWTGLVSNVEYYLKISDVAINTSLHDSFNISLMEAMACGLPCITSDVVGIAPHISVSNGGYLYSLGKFDIQKLNGIICRTRTNLHSNIDSAISRLCYLIQNEDERIEMGKNASKYFHEKFKPEIIITQYEDIFNQLLSKYNENAD